MSIYYTWSRNIQKERTKTKQWALMFRSNFYIVKANTQTTYRNLWIYTSLTFKWDKYIVWLSRIADNYNAINYCFMTKVPNDTSNIIWYSRYDSHYGATSLHSVYLNWNTLSINFYDNSNQWRNTMTMDTWTFNYTSWFDTSWKQIAWNSESFMNYTVVSWYNNYWNTTSWIVMQPYMQFTKL